MISFLLFSEFCTHTASCLELFPKFGFNYLLYILNTKKSWKVTKPENGII